ncbi:MAG: tRNA pseudouridine(55) synthase TruB [Bdellovibrionia bacterium]
MKNTSTPLDGLLLIDKPIGCTSHDLVAKARKILGFKAIGHAGTLDPMASGLMVLLAGEGTKLSDYILNGDKGYRVRIRLGTTTDTLDMTGQILTQTQVSVTREQIENVVREMQGALTLEVPIFSAVRVNGEKLYKAARRGDEVEEPKRIMTFHNVTLLDFGTDWFEVDMRCSKGSFVRSWSREAGRRLGTGAVVEVLRRTGSGPFDVSQAVPLNEEKVSSGFVPMSQALPDWPGMVVDGKDRTLLENGQISYKLRARLKPYVETYMDKPGIKVTAHDKTLIALLTYSEKTRDFALARVFPPSARAPQVLS